MNLIAQASVMMETLGWWVEPISMKDVWRFAGMRSGALFVMITGRPKMGLLHAGSWDFLPQVGHLHLY